MRVILAADHGGFEMKEKLKKYLKEKGYEGVDVGASELREGDDFVDYALEAGQRLQMNFDDRGIVLCRNGVGVSIVANRLSGVRCVLGFDKKQVERAREDDDVNCLALPADYLDLEKAKELVEVFLETKFSNEERFRRRLIKLEMVGEMGGCCGGGCGNC